MASSRFLLLSISSVLIAGLSLSVATVSCSTDNGDNSHGPDVSFPKKDAGTLDGKVVLPDGAIVDPDDDGGNNNEGGSSSGDVDTGVPCNSGTIAVLAGSDTALGGSIQDKNGAWTSNVIANGAAKSKPSLVAFGAGFLGVTHGAGDALQSTSATGATWSAATGFGNAAVKGSPTLALSGTQAHVVYSNGANYNFSHGIHDGANWNAATADVGPPNSAGTVSAGLASVATEIVLAENGAVGAGNEGLFVRSFTGGVWGAGAGVTGAGTVGGSIPATPELVAIEGKWDLLMIYVEKTTRFISYAMRDSVAKTWADGDSIGNAVTTNEKLSLSRVGQFTVVVTFRGQDGKGYYAQGIIGANSISWSAAAAIGGATAFAVDSTPAAARGVCGDDAVVAYASGGSVSVTRLRGTSWTTPEAVTSLSGNRVAIATKP